MDADGEGDEERPAEKEHLIAAEMPSGHAHRDEEDNAGGEHANLRSHRHGSPLAVITLVGS